MSYTIKKSGQAIEALLDSIGDVGALQTTEKKTLVDAVNELLKTASVAGNVRVMDIGSAGLDISTLDFSQYAAGDVILVVGDLAVEQEGGA